MGRKTHSTTTDQPEAEKVHRARVDAVLRALLGERGGPLSAVSLAERAGLHYGHETNRRRVREIVAELREQGRRICAGWKGKSDDSDGSDGTLGYWLARDDAEWQRYLESRRSNARFEFAIVRAVQRAAGEAASGQGRLFEGSRATEWARV